MLLSLLLLLLAADIKINIDLLDSTMIQSQLKTRSYTHSPSLISILTKILINPIQFTHSAVLSASSTFVFISVFLAINISTEDSLINRNLLGRTSKPLSCGPLGTLLTGAVSWCRPLCVGPLGSTCILSGLGGV